MEAEACLVSSPLSKATSLASCLRVEPAVLSVKMLAGRRAHLAGCSMVRQGVLGVPLVEVLCVLGRVDAWK